MSAEKVVLGVLAGAATGALLGVLYAPARGSVTRRQICRKSASEVDALKEKFNDIIDSLTDRFERVKDDVTDLVDEVNDKVEETEKSKKIAKQ